MKHCCLDGSSFTLIRMWTQRPMQLNLLYVQVQYRNAQTLRLVGFPELRLWLVEGSNWALVLALSVAFSFPIMLSYGAGWRPLWAAATLRGLWLASQRVLVATAVSLSWLCREYWLTIHMYYCFLTSHLENKGGYWSENQYSSLTQRYSLNNILIFTSNCLNSDESSHLSCEYQCVRCGLWVDSPEDFCWLKEKHLPSSLTSSILPLCSFPFLSFYLSTYWLIEITWEGRVSKISHEVVACIYINVKVLLEPHLHIAHW